MRDRSEPMRKAWETRRGKAGKAVAAVDPKVRAKTAEAKWRGNPVCCCGCEAKLVKRGGPKTQSLFKPGHDAKLHSLVRKGQPLPPVAETMRAYIGFLASHASK